MVFTAAGNCLVNCYSCTGNKLNLAWAGRKHACSTLIQLVAFFSQNLFCKRKSAAIKMVCLFSEKITTNTGIGSKRAVEQTDAYDDVPSGNLILGPMGQIP